MFHPTRRAILIAATLLAACGDPQASNNDNNTTIPQSIETPRDLSLAIERLVAAQLCRAHFQCPTAFFAEASRYPTEQACAAGLRLPGLDLAAGAEVSIAAGRLDFNKEAIPSCMSIFARQLNALTACEAERPLEALAAATEDARCEPIFVGKVPDGQRCTNSIDCATPRAYCNADELPSCYDTSLCQAPPACPTPCADDEYCDGAACVALAEAGESCRELSCAPGLFCHLTDAESGEQIATCTPLSSLDAGALCPGLSNGEACKPGLRCVDDASDDRRCAAITQLPAGAPCTFQRSLTEPTRCANGLTCVALSINAQGDTSGTCAAPLPIGATCLETLECAPDLRCLLSDPDDRTSPSACQPLATQDQPCDGDHDCAPDLRCRYIDDTNRRCIPAAPFSCTP